MAIQIANPDMPSRMITTSFATNPIWDQRPSSETSMFEFSQVVNRGTVAKSEMGERTGA